MKEDDLIREKARRMTNTELRQELERVLFAMVAPSTQPRERSRYERRRHILEAEQEIRRTAAAQSE